MKGLYPNRNWGLIKFNAKVWSKVQPGSAEVHVRDSGSGLDEFHDPEISGSPRGVMGVHDSGV